MKPSLKAIPCKVRIHRMSGGTWVGIGAIPMGHGRLLTVQEMVEEAPIRRKVSDKVRRQVDRYISRQPVITAGFFGKLWKGIKKGVSKVVKKIGRIKIIKKIGNAIKKAGRFLKKVVKSPIFANVVKFISKVLPFGGVIEMAHEGALKVMSFAEQVQKGVGSALKTLEGIKELAATGDKRAIKTLQEVKKAQLTLALKERKARQAKRGTTRGRKFVASAKRSHSRRKQLLSRIAKTQAPAPQTLRRASTPLALDKLRPVDIWVMGTKAAKGDDSALRDLKRVAATGNKDALWYLQFAE